MSKYQLLREAIAQDPTLAPQIDLSIPPAATDAQLLLAHSADYLSDLKNGTLDRKTERAIGFPYSPEMVERSRRSVGATLAACRDALESGAAVNLAGGTHHAFRDRGEGFCVFNDSVVALKTLQQDQLIERAIVVDTDVHQGNGTANLLADDPSIFTFSIHGEKNYPFRKETSDLDLPLPDGTQDEAYLRALEQALQQMESVKADLVIFQSGADPFEHDKLGRLSLTRDGLKKRDALVLRWCEHRGLAVAVTMGGGYAPEVQDIVDIHLTTVRESLAYSRSRRASSPSW